MRDLARVLRQGFVVKLAGGDRIEAEVELVFPTEFEARLGQGVVTQLRRRVALAEIGGVGGDLVGDQPVFHVLLVGQAEMLLRRHIAKHGATVPADHRRADARGDMVVTRRDVGGQRPERVERRFVADFELLFHVLADQVHGHVAGTFDHRLHVVFPGDFGEFAEGFEFGELGRVVGVGDRTGAQAVAEREGYVIGLHDFADFLEMRVEETFLVVGQAPLGHDRAAAGDDAGDALGGQRHAAQQHAGMDGEIVDSLLGLFDQGVPIYFPGQFLGDAADFFQRLVDRHRADGKHGIANDPFARFVDVPASGQVHHGIGAPKRRPDEFLHLFLDRGSDRRIADVGIDLDQEIAADDHRFDFGVVDIGGYDGPAPGHFVAHEFRRDFPRYRRAEGFPCVIA